MRFSIFLSLPLSFLCVSCAYEGTIVQKNTRPHPFYESLGVEEMSSIDLRDQAGLVHRQMVTPEVYARYANGQYFNDQAAAPNEDKEMEPTLVPMRPVKPIAGSYQRTSGNAVIARASTQGGPRPVARPGVATGAALKTASRPAVVAHANILPAPPAQRVAATQNVPAHIAAARKVSPDVARVKPSTPSVPVQPVASANIAHFSAEITAKGLQPAKKSSATTKPSSAKKAKALLKAPSVETRTDADNVSAETAR